MTLLSLKYKLKQQKMEHNKKNVMLTIKALGLAGLQADPKTITLIIQMYQMVEDKSDDISLKDITKLQIWVEKQYPQIITPKPELKK